MLNSAEAKYILSEIRNIEFYSDEINRLQNMYDNIQTEIDSLSVPHSVVTDKPLTGKVSVRDSRNLNEDRLLCLISRQQAIEKNMVKWKNMLSDA